jgi:hypothetical protein
MRIGIVLWLVAHGLWVAAMVSYLVVFHSGIDWPKRGMAIAMGMESPWLVRGTRWITEAVPEEMSWLTSGGIEFVFMSLGALVRVAAVWLLCTARQQGRTGARLTAIAVVTCFLFGLSVHVAPDSWVGSWRSEDGHDILIQAVDGLLEIAVALQLYALAKMLGPSSRMGVELVAAQVLAFASATYVAATRWHPAEDGQAWWRVHTMAALGGVVALVILVRLYARARRVSHERAQV